MAGKKRLTKCRMMFTLSFEESGGLPVGRHYPEHGRGVMKTDWHRDDHERSPRHARCYRKVLGAGHVYMAGSKGVKLKMKNSSTKP